MKRIFQKSIHFILITFAALLLAQCSGGFAPGAGGISGDDGVASQLRPVGQPTDEIATRKKDRTLLVKVHEEERQAEEQSAIEEATEKDENQPTGTVVRPPAERQELFKIVYPENEDETGRTFNTFEFDNVDEIAHDESSPSRPYVMIRKRLNINDTGKVRLADSRWEASFPLEYDRERPFNNAYYVYACYQDGDKFYKSDVVEVFSPHEIKTITANLWLKSSREEPCPPEFHSDQQLAPE